MKDKNGVEVVSNATVRCKPKTSQNWDEYVVDGIDNHFIVLHNVFGPIMLPVDSLDLEVLPERVLKKEDFKSKRE